MERNVEKEMEAIVNLPNVSGCILTDKSGLSLGVKGNASGNSAGLIAAIANQAAQLDPELDPPIISLQNNSRQCIIHQSGPVIGAIFKDTSQ
ncbi:ragulator complex protein LAMTOR5 homolog [Chelonus insularis]|uniref:ragulator complex protein LAMTOR5 homolog n=1 Tax=Chelonus insularis TaxID=460826 RepID=UPI001588E773|nr:ragulator complex protein LAMTOR5 homolog [Chelonus insularis]